MRLSSKVGVVSIVGVLLALAIAWAAVGNAQGRGAQGRGGAAAQQAPPQRISVAVAQVKPDMVGT